MLRLQLESLRALVRPAFGLLCSYAPSASFELNSFYSYSNNSNSGQSLCDLTFV